MTDPNQPTNQSGIALIAVLGVLSLLALLTATVVTISQTQRLRTATLTHGAASVYADESAAKLAIWLLMSDKARFTDRTLSGKIETALAVERYLADGRPHEMELNGRKYTTRIYDMFSGITVSGANPENAFGYLSRCYADDPAKLDKLETFKSRLADYVDADDLIRLNSMERTDYDSRGMRPLPRNGAMQYREELLWIPGGEEFISSDDLGMLSMINPIPEPGGYLPGGKPNLLCAPLELIRDKCDLSASEVELVKEGLRQIKDDGVTFDDAFMRHTGMRERLNQEFSLTESGHYTLIIAPAGGVGRTLIITLPVAANLPPEKIKFIQYQWL